MCGHGDIRPSVPSSPGPVQVLQVRPSDDGAHLPCCRGAGPEHRWRCPLQPPWKGTSPAVRLLIEGRLVTKMIRAQAPQPPVLVFTQGISGAAKILDDGERSQVLAELAKLVGMLDGHSLGLLEDCCV